MFSAGCDRPVGAEHENFSWQNVADKFSAHLLKRAAFRGDNVGAVRRFAVTERSKTVGIPDRHDFGCRHHHHGIGAFDDVHRLADGIFNRSGFKSFTGNDISNGFRVTGGVENRAVQFELIPQFIVVDFDGLAVGPNLFPGCRVTDMAHRHRTRRHAVEIFFGKNVADQPEVLVGIEQAVVVDDNAAALLTPMLQGVKPVIGQPR